ATPSSAAAKLMPRPRQQSTFAWKLSGRSVSACCSFWSSGCNWGCNAGRRSEAAACGMAAGVTTGERDATGRALDVDLEAIMFIRAAHSGVVKDPDRQIAPARALVVPTSLLRLRACRGRRPANAAR